MQEALSFLGIEIGGTKLQLLKADAAGNAVQTIRYTIDAASGAAGIRHQLTKALLDFNVNDVTAIGVGFGGPVDWQSGCIRTSHQVSGWADFNLAKWLSEKTGKPVVLENDANTAALAEALHGSGKGHAVVFYITIGSGIGGGIVVNKEIYHGRQPGEVEIGHVRLDKNGKTLEEACSGWAVNEKVKQAILQQPNGLLAMLAKQHATGHEAKLLQSALAQEDKSAKAIMDETANDLAFALSHVVHLFHPGVLILGGGLSLLKEWLRKPVEEKLSRYVMQAFLPPPPVVIAALEENAVPVGAVELAKKWFHQHQLSTRSAYEEMD